jgi:hypothetical protein
LSVESPEISEQAYQCERCGAEYAGGEGCPICGLLRAAVPCDGEAGETRFRCVICEAPICGAEPEGTRPAVCELHEGIPVMEAWAQVYTTSDDIEANLIVQNLQSEGVDAELFSQKDGIFPVDLGELAIVRVMVPTWEYQGAIEIIRAHMDNSGEVSFACPACGEAYEPGDASCSSCGAPLG